MKVKIIIFLSLFIIYSCSNKAEKKSGIISLKEVQLKKSIFGSWQMCKIIDNGIETSYNVCPTIIFYGNGSGNIISSKKITCNFQFQLKNNVIVFSFKSLEDKKSFFTTDSEFNSEFRIQGNTETLDLSQVKTDVKFILSRVIQN